MKRKIEQPSPKLLRAMEEARILAREDDSDGQPFEVALAELKLSCLR